MLTDPGEAGMWRGRWDGRTDGARDWVTYEEFQELRDRSGIFASVMASQSSLGLWQARINVDGGGEAPEEVRGRMVSGAYFQVLGANPAAGRVFTADADRVDTPEAVISHSFWQRRFGGRDDVIGRTLTIRNATLSIVGVMPPAFVGETSGQLPDLWVPLRLQPRVLPGNNYLHDAPPDKAMWLHVFGRLKPGVSLAEAEARANAVMQANLIAFYGAAATGERRAEFLDQRLQITDASRGASYKRAELSGSLTALLVGVGDSAADRVREPREPAARARRRSTSGDDAAALARGRPRPADAPARDRESRPRVRRRTRGRGRRGGDAPCARRHARRGRSGVRALVHLRRVDCRLPRRLHVHRRAALRAAARVAGDGHRCRRAPSRNRAAARIGSRMRGRSGRAARRRAARAVAAAPRRRGPAGAHRLQRAAHRSRPERRQSVDSRASTSARRSTIPRGATRCARRCSNASVRHPAFGARPSRSSGCSPAHSPPATSRSRATRRRPAASTGNKRRCRGPRLLRDARHAAGPGTRHPGQRHARGAEGLRRQRSVREPVLRPSQSDRSPRHGHRQRRAADPVPRRRRGQRCAHAIAEGTPSSPGCSSRASSRCPASPARPSSCARSPTPRLPRLCGRRSWRSTRTRRSPRFAPPASASRR